MSDFFVRRLDSSEQRATDAWPVSRFLPSPGNVFFTLIVAAGLVAAFFLFPAPRAAAPTTAAVQQIPAIPTVVGTQAIAYQGRLVTAGNNPVADGNYAITFKLYDAPANGNLLWTEPWPSVAVANGLFNVMLGTYSPNLSSVVQSNTNLWLGVTVGSDPEMSPRVQLGSAAYAMQALSVPNGSISTAQLASGSVSQVINKSILAGDVFTTSSSTSDVPGATVTMTTSGGPVLLLFTISATNCSDPFTAISGYWQIIRTDLPAIQPLAFNTKGFSTLDWDTMSLFAIDTPSAGTYTYKVVWYINQGLPTGAKLCASQGYYSQNFAAIELKR